MENWDPLHPLSTCDAIFFPPKFLNMQHWGEHYISKTKEFIFQSGQWKFFINGLTGLSNILLKFYINPKYIEPKDLIKIFGKRFRDFPLEYPKTINLEIIKQSITSFCNLYLKECILFYITFILMRKIQDKAKIDEYKLLVNDLIVRDKLRSFIKTEFTLVFIDFVLNSKFSIIKVLDIETWLKENLLQIFKKNEFYDFIYEYLSNFNFEKEYMKKQLSIINVEAPFSKLNK
jgi:hypothetical protein